MNLKQYYLTDNACYKQGTKHEVEGLMVHSTGANNPYLSRYVGPDDGILGVNKYGNHWNQDKPSGRYVCVHAFIGLDKNDMVRTYQTLPWDMLGWHSGSGSLGYSKNANNNGYIGFEICEAALDNKEYFLKVYQEAVELSAFICKKYNLKPESPYLIDHTEGHKLGIASNHSDTGHWFPKHGKNMDTFRADVKKILQEGGTEGMNQGIKVTIKLTANNYATGELIPPDSKGGRIFTIAALGSPWGSTIPSARLEEINSWVRLTDLQPVTVSPPPTATVPKKDYDLKVKEVADLKIELQKERELSAKLNASNKTYKAQIDAANKAKQNFKEFLTWAK